MKRINWIPFVIAFFVIIVLYTFIGTGTRVDEIKELAPKAMAERNWKILRYEGYEWGSWNRHGGKVWYHVANIDNPQIQYRVNVSLWNGELQWYYDAPEILNRINVDLKKQSE